jgi:hypothetical protein
MKIVERYRLTDPDNDEHRDDHLRIPAFLNCRITTNPPVETSRNWTISEYVLQENNRNSVDQSGKAAIRYDAAGSPTENSEDIDETFGLLRVSPLGYSSRSVSAAAAASLVRWLRYGEPEDDYGRREAGGLLNEPAYLEKRLESDGRATDKGWGDTYGLEGHEPETISLATGLDRTTRTPDFALHAWTRSQSRTARMKDARRAACIIGGTRRPCRQRS